MASASDHPAATRPYRAAILTVSDSSSFGTRADTSGPALAEMLRQNGYTVVAQEMLADDQSRISAMLIQLCEAAELVITTGGTGLGARDVTPEATLAILERQVPGLAELMRSAGTSKTPTAALSRSVCGTRGRALVVNLPGNPAGAADSLGYILHLIPHALELLRGNTVHAEAVNDK